MLRLIAPSLLLSTVAALLAPPARAQSGYIKHPGATREWDHSVTPMVGISSRYGVEAGVKADFLLATPGFVPMINDSVFLEGAAFVAPHHLFVAPLLRWDFNLHPQWTVYGESGIEANLHAGGSDETDDDPGARLVLGAGAIWRMPAKDFYLRGEVDLPRGVARVGPMIEF